MAWIPDQSKTVIIRVAIPKPPPIPGILREALVRLVTISPLILVGSGIILELSRRNF